MSKLELSELGKIVNDNILHFNQDEINKYYTTCYLDFKLLDNECIDDYVYSLHYKRDGFKRGVFVKKHFILDKISHELYFGISSPLYCKTIEYSLTDFKQIKIELSLKINNKTVINYENCDI